MESTAVLTFKESTRLCKCISRYKLFVVSCTIVSLGGLLVKEPIIHKIPLLTHILGNLVES